MPNEVETFTHEAAEIDIAADLTELFADLTREFDIKGLVPESRVSTYSFRGECNFYSFPSIVREYIDLFNLSVDKVAINVGKTAKHLPGVAIQLFMDSGDMLELSTHRDQKIEEPFGLTVIGDGHPVLSNKYTVTPYEVGQLLISMALPPSDASEIDRAKAERHPIAMLNPRDTQVLQLIENSLENQASFHETTQEFNMAYCTDVDNTVTDFSLISTKNSNGDTLYVASAKSNTTEKGTIYSYDISVVCNSLKSINDINEIMSKGIQAQTSIDGARAARLSEGTVTSYMSAIAKALIDKED